MEDRLENFLKDWLDINGFVGIDVEVCDNEFFYSDGLSMIAVSLSSDPTDEYFMYYLRELGLLLDFSSSFIPSFLHELGHHETLDIFDEDDFTEYFLMQSTLYRSGSKTTYDDCLTYFTNPIETAASQWAVDYMNTHQSEIFALADGLKKIFAEKE